MFKTWSISSSPRGTLRSNIEEVYVKCDIMFTLLVNSALGYYGRL